MLKHGRNILSLNSRVECKPNSWVTHDGREEDHVTFSEIVVYLLISEFVNYFRLLIRIFHFLAVGDFDVFWSSVD